jgi:hypothetical protein
MKINTESRLPRRDVLKWFASVTAATQLNPVGGLTLTAATSTPGTKGYGTDPDLAGHYQPGDFWPLTLTENQRRIAIALADLILPQDHLGPAASELRVVDYLDEWISAPYPRQVNDRREILAGLDWLEKESQRRFTKGFSALDAEQMRQVVDDICWPPDARPQHKRAAAFFQTFRSIAAGAYYATEPGWKAIGYVGNEALISFNGPPQEVLDQLGVEQTVKSGPIIQTGGFE